MDIINVQFDDDTHGVIVSYFAGPQDPDVWPNVGQVVTDDARWVAYYNAAPAMVRPFLPAPGGFGA